MKILFLSFYYSPELCTVGFRSKELVSGLLEQLPDNAHIDVITTKPNRYRSYTPDVDAIEKLPRLTIHRVDVAMNKGSIIEQIRAFAVYAYQVLKYVRKRDYQLIYGTSSRLMTAVLSAYVARKKKALLYLDIRDIFVDLMKDWLPSPAAKPVAWFFSLLERWAIKRADRINLISEGFKGYYQERFPSKSYAYFPNCISDEFVDAANSQKKTISICQDQPITVLYAGNIGVGQGLHKIIPTLAKRLEGRVIFRLIGGGADKVQLEQRLAQLGCKNVALLPPINRSDLLVEYQQADLLFVHLNDYEVFKKVVPSKLFEYAAMGKPIWAGVSGYAADFIEKEISNAAVFQPCHVKEAISVFYQLKLSPVRRDAFISKFACQSVIKNMAKDIVGLVNT